ncbi:hypothetical protein D9613_009836 [Agrocybe pediades]|uniref:Small ribosomal subunit protein uS7 domain-containing protein n=1 Tax=Agrocybe pediades TaxID=84607 RepID=A0A8H4VQI7_9AGAR|nr:hypothetical protein D9613_009836 [Agrocybe pediades]
MLASLRRPATRALSRLSCTASTSTTSGSGRRLMSSSTTTPEKPMTEEEEALAVLNELTSKPNNQVTASESLLPSKPLDLDSMHHYIPPAQSPILQLMTTMIMKDGKYASAATSISQMLLHIHAMTRSPPVPIVTQAVLLASPSVRLRRQKQGGGKTVIKPQALSERQRTRQGIQWLVEAANKKAPTAPGKTIAERLAREVIGILKGTSSVLAKKVEVHGAATVNRGNLPKKF